MHGSLRDGLEDLLAVKLSAAAPQAAKKHIDSCSECASEFYEFRAQAELLRSLRLAEQMEPSPGFYARVLQRIEAGAKKSIWWVFAYSPLGKRLAYVSLATAIVLGSYVVAQESRDGSLHRGTLHSGTLVAADDVHRHYDAPVVGNTDQQREAVLQNFASHPGTLQ